MTAFLLLPLSLLSLYFFGTWLYTHFVLPRKAELHFRKQGIVGPPRRPLFGNAAEFRDLMTEAESRPLPIGDHAVVRRVCAYDHKWSALYGKVFVFWFGSCPRLSVGDPALVKQILFDSSGTFEKADFNPLSKVLFGEGLVVLKGSKWSQHRRILSPAFSMERVKGWVSEIAAAASKMLDKWGKDAGEDDEFELEVSKELHGFTADVIARVAFGSNFEEARKIFELQEQQMEHFWLAIRSVYIPGFRFIPTQRNRTRKKLDKEIRDSMRSLIEAKSESCQNTKNLLGLMLSADRSGEKEEDKIGIEDIIDECKTFYFAGKETTANLLTWALMLLALYRDWQEKAREEVVDAFGGRDRPVAGDIGSLRIVTMILNETLRLYPPTVALSRLTSRDIKLGAFDIPAGTYLHLPKAAINHDPEIWGDDADQFDPARFADAKRPSGAAFFPFGFGPMICAGQNLAIVEAKVALAMILKRFSLRLSPTYVHAPRVLLTLQPQYGVQVILQKI